MVSKEIWGKAQWEALHSYAACYQKHRKKAFISYINALTVIMPCESCRNHFKETLKMYPIEKYLKNNQEALLWTYIAHDRANMVNGKQSPPFLFIKNKYLMTV